MVKSLFHKKEDDSKLVKIFPDKLPEKTDIWCWWCCHEFDSIPISMPLRYNKTKDSFELIGAFCSFSCCKAYILDSYNTSPTIISNLKLMSKKMGLDYKDKIIPAPPRRVLKAFRGIMSIEEFREKSKQNLAINLLSSNQCILSDVVKETKIGEISESTGNKIDFTSHEEHKKEYFSLKRDKPLKRKKGTLEDAMGLKITRN